MAIECRHCDGTGTCSNGENGNSCASCAEKAREGAFPLIKKKLSSTKGLPCGTCRGYGDLEAYHWQTQSIISPIIGIVVIASVVGGVLIIAAAGPTHHAQILTLLGTLAGSVVGFYFKGQHTLPKAPQSRSQKLPPPTPPKRGIPDQPKNGPGVDSAS